MVRCTHRCCVRYHHAWRELLCLYSVDSEERDRPATRRARRHACPSLSSCPLQQLGNPTKLRGRACVPRTVRPQQQQVIMPTHDPLVESSSSNVRWPAKPSAVATCVCLACFAAVPVCVCCNVYEARGWLFVGRWRRGAPPSSPGIRMRSLLFPT